MISNILFKGIPLFCSIVMIIYFMSLLKGKKKVRKSIMIDDTKEQQKLNNMRKISLTMPLSETTRPTSFEEIIGQDRGLLALKAAICGPNPQHVIIYGEPGIGKTAAARVALDAAKEMCRSPFAAQARFVEIDATTLRFDERGVADPLIGSVHDPIYQGAGAYGAAGIPQPKMGAVTKAHGGILFIDEIGELHTVQMNKLLKILEDRKVFLESSYYSSEDKNIPHYIRDIFENGLPADFRLVGATTCNPSDITPALRSRCMEIFFDSLGQEDIRKIATNAAKKAVIGYEESVIEIVSDYAANGRDAVNMIQTAGSIANLDNRRNITRKDMEWVIETGQYSPRPSMKIVPGLRVGVVNGLAVQGMRRGSLLRIEVTAEVVMPKEGKLIITGIIEEEEFRSSSSTSSKRTSSARGSIDNALTLIERLVGINSKDYNIHINYPGGNPVDGPSAGIAIFIALYSAILCKPISGEIAMTGEVSIIGKVYPVGGVYAKIMAAKVAGVKKVIIPIDNQQSTFCDIGIEIIPVSQIEEVIQQVFNKDVENIQLTAQELLNA
ncbi:MAG TPA: ATP-dependent protease LonB [Epulopiscium sp.]|nr:ATP-dependent protease LonB [Candidatus Epulonipiscium sp.]